MKRTVRRDGDQAVSTPEHLFGSAAAGYGPIWRLWGQVADFLPNFSPAGYVRPGQSRSRGLVPHSPERCELVNKEGFP